MTKSSISLLQHQQPIIFTIANTVTSGKVADALSAIGASPIMSTAPEEAQQLVNISHAVVLNLGTPSKLLSHELELAAETANQTNTPLVLDPVACASTAFRLELARTLLGRYQFTVIRGNAGEIAALTNIAWHGHGIDAGSGNGDLIAIAKKCALEYGTTVVLSGRHDIITDGDQVLINRLSSRWLTVNVGSGDILSSFIGAFLGIGIQPTVAGLTACRLVTLAGVRAGKAATGIGSWQPHFLDELALVTDQDLLTEE